MGPWAKLQARRADSVQLLEFNKVLFKKDVSPFKKWTYVEGLATYLKIRDLMYWMGTLCLFLEQR
jgi:hypothetical protein